MKRVHDFQWFQVRWLARYGWILDRAAAVVVVPIAPDDRVWLARVHRVPTGTSSWEFPGGGVGRGEDIAVAGLRELAEECGLVALGEVRVLPQTLELAPGMGRFPHHVVIARDVVPVGAGPVPQLDEGIEEVRKMTRKQVDSCLAKGEISVLATATALLVSGWLRGKTVDR